jgi:hypothetical protein
MTMYFMAKGGKRHQFSQSITAFQLYARNKRSQFLRSYNITQFQRLAVSSKTLTLNLRRDVDVRQGKMASLPYRQASDTSHDYVVLLNNYKNENFYKE